MPVNTPQVHVKPRSNRDGRSPDHRPGDLDDQPVNFAAFRHRPSPIERQLKKLVYIALVWTGISFLLMLASSSLSLLAAVFQVSAWLGVSVIAIAMLVAAALVFKESDGDYWQFVADNGWKGQLKLDLNLIATSLLGAGHSRAVTGGFTGTYRGFPMNTSMYQYSKGMSGGSYEDTYTFLDLRLELRHPFPTIILDGKKNNFLGVSSIPKSIHAGRLFELEGDFNKYYNVTILPGTERDVLHVLTPDFMFELLDADRQTDIELSGTTLHVFIKGSSFNETDLKCLFTTVDICIKHLRKLSKTWQASSSEDTLTQIAQTAAGPREKLSGRSEWIYRISVSMVIAAGVIACFILIEIKNLTVIPFVILGTIVLAVLTAFLHRRNHKVDLD